MTIAATQWNLSGRRGSAATLAPAEVRLDTNVGVAERSSTWWTRAERWKNGSCPAPFYLA